MLLTLLHPTIFRAPFSLHQQKQASPSIPLLCPLPIPVLYSANHSRVLLTLLPPTIFRAPFFLHQQKQASPSIPLLPGKPSDKRAGTQSPVHAISALARKLTRGTVSTCRGQSSLNPAGSLTKNTKRLVACTAANIRSLLR